MARFHEPTPEQEAVWGQWVAERPDKVREVAQRFDPWTLYQMKNTGQLVYVYSFGEEADGSVTMTVDITGQFNLIAFDQRVFGIDPDNLKECDLPDEGQPLGGFLNEDEQLEYINARRKLNGLPPIDQMTKY